MKALPTMPNARPDIAMRETHVIRFPAGMCPVSGMPLEGSTMEIAYTPNDKVIDVLCLDPEMRKYGGGAVGGVRNMEEVPQHFGQRIADALGVVVDVICKINLLNDQQMILEFEAVPNALLPVEE